MISDFIVDKIREQFPFTPTQQQGEAVCELANFISKKSIRKAFILKGYAGTGKTTVVAALVKALEEIGYKCVLMAPTGRAAKVIAAYSHHPAYTIHKKIYRCQQFGNTQFSLFENLHSNTLFIVDEASMISNDKDSSSFGSGRLLDDLISYVYNGKACHLLLLGDSAQLPPVHQEHSPALEEEWLQGYGIDVSSYELTHVVRQALQSGILYNATLLRHQLTQDGIRHKFQFETDGFDDICHINGQEMLDELQRSYQEVGETETVVITRSNKRANLYNRGIRNFIMYKEEELSVGDLIMLSRNNYFWAKDYDGIDFLANGDMMEIRRIRKYHELYDLRFVDVALKALDYDWEIDATLLLDSLHVDGPSDNQVFNQQLFQSISEDYPEIRDRRKLIEIIKTDPHYNAIQARFAYAITCHKAQGGQWERVFIDQGNIPEDHLDLSYYRWLYTALTRAGTKVYLVNFPH